MAGDLARGWTRYRSPASTPIPGPTLPPQSLAIEPRKTATADIILPVLPPELMPGAVLPSHPRSWRNSNPGNLRPIQNGPQWQGCISIDDAPGGPFVVFETRTMGWRALARLLLTYRDKHGLRTVRDILTRYAPAMENDTPAYIAAVAKRIGVAPNDPVNITEPYVMRELLLAIAAHEGGRSCPAWPGNEVVEGMRLAGIRGL